MIAARLDEPDDFAAWRQIARQLVQAGIEPGHVAWQEMDGEPELFGAMRADLAIPERISDAPEVKGSLGFLELAKAVILHRDPARLPLLYRLLWRLQSQRGLLEDAADPDVIAANALAKQVRRDIHKMRAFVRFREADVGEADMGEAGQPRFIAWFEPDHRIERHNAKFFVERFANQAWSILTPRLSLHWDTVALHEGPGARREDAPAQDATEELWRNYYRSTFNPARLKIGTMTKEMPRRYWKNLPETRDISGLIAGARQRELAMVASGASRFEVERPETLAQLAQAIGACQRCPIGCNGTQAVAGEGKPASRLMILGEQPGDNEEASGRPFVGPAGQLLDEHLQQAGIARGAAYMTNAVKHFKFTPQGKRRLHQTPSAREIDMCRWWLESERDIVRPELVLALGASAGRALLGRTPSIGRERGQVLRLADGTAAVLTNHPSYLLRLDGEARQREEARFASDLRMVAELIPKLDELHPSGLG